MLCSLWQAGRPHTLKGSERAAHSHCCPSLLLPLSSPKQMTSLRSCLRFTYFLHWSSLPVDLAADSFGVSELVFPPSGPFLLCICFLRVSPPRGPGSTGGITGNWRRHSLSVPRESESLGMGLARRPLAPSTSIA